jgi:hypothetical protein
MPYKDPSTYTEYHRQYYIENKKRLNEQNRCNYIRNRKERIEYAKNDYIKHKEKRSIQATLRTRRNKLKVKAFLGGACSCCYEKEPEALTIDHVANDGAKERKKAGSEFSNDKVYRYILKCIKAGVSTTEIKKKYDILCSTCNLSKHLGHGTCFHRRAFVSHPDFPYSNLPPNGDC